MQLHSTILRCQWNNSPAWKQFAEGEQIAECSLAGLLPINEGCPCRHVVADESFFTWTRADLEAKFGRGTELELCDDLQCVALGGERGGTAINQMLSLLLSPWRRSRNSGIGL